MVFTAQVEIAPHTQVLVQFLAGNDIISSQSITNATNFFQLHLLSNTSSLTVDRVNYIIV